MRAPNFRRMTKQTIDTWMNGVWNVCYMFTFSQFASGIHFSFRVEQIRKGFSGAWSMLVYTVDQEELSKQRIALYQLKVWLKLKDKRKQRKAHLNNFYVSVCILVMIIHNVGNQWKHKKNIQFKSLFQTKKDRICCYRFEWEMSLVF